MSAWVVTQICNLLYRRIALGRTDERIEISDGNADCKSAIRQIKNLRYAGGNLSLQGAFPVGIFRHGLE